MTRISVLRGAAVFLVCVFIAACGGGGSGGSGSGGTGPPTALSYPQPPAFILNQPIVPLTPSSSGGAVTSYSISPSLPAGLSLNASTGVISGTPTVAAAQATYTVTAANSAGSTQGSVSLLVVSAAVAYPSSSYAYTVGGTTQSIHPVVAYGVPFTSWSVSPPLPPGLTLNATDGSITGNPTAAAAAASYTITGMTPGGPESTNLTIVVVAAPLLDLGLSSRVTLMRYSGNSVLSQDYTDRWLLQDFTTGATLATADEAGAVLSNGGGSYVDLQNNVMIDQGPAGLNVRSAATGQVMATIPYPPKVSWYRLAIDGSYIAAGSPTALMAWSTSGQMLVSHAGDYSKATPFAAPGQMQVALGPAGQSVIETVAVPSGTESVSPPFQGVFDSWFVDGQRFLTNQGNVVWTYSSAGVQQNFTSVNTITQLVGQGNYFWTLSPTTDLSIYAVGSNAGPVLTIAGPVGAAVPSGSTIGLLSGQVTIVDLSGAKPVVSGPFSDPCAGGNFAAQSATQWVAGNGSGVICAETSTGNPRTLTLGAAWGVVAGTSYIGVATASGKLFYFNASDDSQAGVINFSVGSQLSASADGTVLATLPNIPLTSETDIYSLPSGKKINSFPMSYLALIQTGTSIAFANNSTATTCPSEIMVVPVTGGAPLYCMAGAPQYGSAVFSPDGTLGALSTQVSPSDLGTTTVYKNGTLTTAVPGVASGWLDNNRVLVTEYKLDPMLIEVFRVGSNIYDTAGNKLGSTTATFGNFQVVSLAPDSVYAAGYDNVIVSLTSGTTTWASGNIVRSTYTGGNATGGVTGRQVIFASDNLVLAQPY